jgi:hypothetical protein
MSWETKHIFIISEVLLYMWVNFTFKIYAVSLFCVHLEQKRYFHSSDSIDPRLQRETKATGKGETERSEFHERALLEFYFHAQPYSFPPSLLPLQLLEK